ncbi:MAG TPA: GH25 family lysozyme [Kofleriaceae bacterium]|nr:GH25 family lysozyme [Kofleriaceae bacterium]
MNHYTLLPLFALAACASTSTSTDDETAISSDEQALVSCATGSMVAGVDVSHWNGSINWSSVRASGRRFAYISIGDSTYVDPMFSANWTQAKAAGLYRGVYQYFRASEDPIAQANVIISRVGQLGPGDLPVMLDLEDMDGMSAATVISRVQSWLIAVQRGTSRLPIIYTNSSTFDFGMGAPRGFAGYPLFVANWQVNCPNIPNTWKSWKAWQWSATGHVPGIAGDVDLDVFNGGLAQLASYAEQGADCVFGDGDYCGGNGVKGDPRSLFRCSGGQKTLKKVCAEGCVVKPAGEDDVCAPASFCPAGDGPYCGGDLIGGDRNTLYQCQGGAVTEQQKCANGCSWAPFGSDDHCN